MRKDPKIDLLRSLPGFRGYPDKALSRVAQIFDDCEIPAGTCLTREGAPSREMFLVIDGVAEVTRAGERIAMIGPGECIGEMGMLDHQPRSATVVAQTAMRLLVVGPDNFTRVLDAPAILRRIATDINARLRSVQAHDSAESTHNEQAPSETEILESPPRVSP